MTNDEKTKTVTVEYTHLTRDENDVNINLAEYRAWLGLQPDETIEFLEDDIIEYLRSGPNTTFEISGFYHLEDFNIEQVNFDCG